MKNELKPKAESRKPNAFPKQILTTAEAATFLGVGPKVLKRLMEAGHVRRLRGFHKPYKFSRVELERYLREGMVV